MADHTDVRRDFLECRHTIQNVRRDFPEWHLGRARYAMWAIDLDCPAVRQQVATAGQHLADLLLDGYRRQPHLTLTLCGFPSHTREHADDFGVENLEAQIEALRRARLKPFDIEIGALASFSSAPFFHISDASDGISALCTCLTSVKLDDRSADYTAHVTVGLYSGTWPSEAVSIRLDTFPRGDTSCCLIHRISLMSYAAAEIGGPLTTIADYHFDQAEIEWHETPFLNEDQCLIQVAPVVRQAGGPSPRCLNVLDVVSGE